jgi:hypothetical protein
MALKHEILLTLVSVSLRHAVILTQTVLVLLLISQDCQEKNIDVAFLHLQMGAESIAAVGSTVAVAIQMNHDAVDSKIV